MYIIFVVDKSEWQLFIQIIEVGILLRFGSYKSLCVTQLKIVKKEIVRLVCLVCQLREIRINF